MAKQGFRLEFRFIPMPEEVLTAQPALLHVEWVVLAYLLKQVRYGEALQAVTLDELMNGIRQTDGSRKDSGCGLSRNAASKGMLALENRGWITTERIATDPTRPRYQITLNLRSKGETQPVTTRQHLSQRDSSDLSQRDDSLSQRDDQSSHNVTAPVTTRRAYKEVESTKNLDSKEKQGEGRPASASVLIIAQQRFMTALGGTRQELIVFFSRSENPRRALFERVQAAAKEAGLEYPAAQEFLSDHPDWKNWEDLHLLGSQREIDFGPNALAPQPVTPDASALRAWEIISGRLKTTINPHSFDTWLKPIRGVRLNEGILRAQVPTSEFKHVGEKFRDQLEQARTLAGVERVEFLTIEELAAA